MFNLLFIVSIIGTIVQIFKEKFTPQIPYENFRNRKLYNEDLMNGASIEQLMKNVKDGKYRIEGTFPEPHRDPKDGKIIIENSKLYYEDVDKYGAWQAQEWVKQGKYNLY